MQQYFIEGKANPTVTVTDKETLKHMFQVMRLKEDDKVVLVFDDGKKHLARVKDQVGHVFELLEPLADDVELPVEVTLASGFLKGDKLEWLTQKVTELGAHQIWSFPADWSVSKWDAKKLGKKQEKLAKIAKGAAEQSKRNRVPKVSLFETKAAFLEQVETFDWIVVAYEESAKEGEMANLVRLFEKLKKGDRVLFVFGPEGGLSPEEITALTQRGGELVGLGPRIMRAETAPLYALSSLSYACELKH